MTAQKRYSVVNVAWRRIGPREGLFRRRRLQLREKVLGEADELEVAAHLIAITAIYADEAVYIYDRRLLACEPGQPLDEGSPTVVAAKFGWLWER